MVDESNDGLDGLGDGDGRRLIKGMKIRFTNDSQWMAGEEEIAKDREFLVIKIVKAKQKWIGGQPVETYVLPAYEPITDIEVLNKAALPEEMTEKFGKMVGPWDWSYVAYLIDPKTSQIFTYPTNTEGGGQAIRDLRETVGMARRMHGDGVYPRVRLGDTFMKTRYGGRQRPAFDILGYEELGAPAPTALPASEAKQIEPPKPADPVEQKADKPADPVEPKAGKTAAAPKPKSKTHF
jgi:hypothetical protein